jgi:hypothetical protein
MRLYSLKLSRRNLLQGAAYASAGVALVADSHEPVAAEGLKSKASVAYQSTPHGHERCEICSPFLPPNKCRTVAGTVSRQAWCKAYQGA